MAGWVEEHPNVRLPLMPSHRRSQSNAPAVAASRSPPWKSKCIIGLRVEYEALCGRKTQAISSLALGPVQRLVGSSEEVLVAEVSVVGGADAYRHRARLTRAEDDRAVPDDADITLSQGDPSIEGRVRQHEHEFLAAPSGGDIPDSKHALQAMGYLPEHGVTTRVTVPIIYELEVVNIEHENGERSLMAPCRGDLGPQSIFTMTAVV